MYDEMGIGDTLYFYWAINWDSGINWGFDGNKGFDLFSGSNKLYNINNGNSSAITSDDQLNPVSVANNNFGVLPMRVKLVRENSNYYIFSMTSRVGDQLVDTVFSSQAVNKIKFYSLFQATQIGSSADNERNLYFNIQVRRSSSYFTWSPSYNLNLINPLAVQVSPDITTTYFINSNFSSCNFQDSVIVSVNDKTGIDNQTSCDSYTWIDGNTYTSSNNTATHTLTAVAGCDSVVTLNLTINNSKTGMDNQTSCDSYTWIDGNTYTVVIIQRRIH